MTTQELFDITATKIIRKIRKNTGLSQFAVERSKFEGWLKVELINILNENELLAKPEINRIDVSFNDIFIELKTVISEQKIFAEYIDRFLILSSVLSFL